MQWARFIKSFESNLRMSKEKFQEDLHSYHGAIPHRGQVKEPFEELRKRLVAIGDDAFTRFGLSGVLAGFWCLDYKSIKMERNIPVVKFDSFTAATEHVQELIKSGSVAAIQKQINKAWVNTLEEEDPTKYTSYIVFSLAYALAGQWSVAYRIAKAAHSIAVSWLGDESTLKSMVKGDEAAYLCAVFSRLCAKNLDNLKTSQDHLNAATKLQKTSPIRSSLQSINIEDYTDPRFASEKLACNICIRFFLEFAPENVGGHRGDMWEQLAKISTIKDESNKYIEARKSIQMEPNTFVREYVSMQLSANFLQLQLLAQGKNETSSLLPTQTRDFLSDLDGFMKGSKQRNHEDYFHGKPSWLCFVYICASATFYPELIGWNDQRTREELLARLEKYGKELRLMPYDQQRVGFFVNVVRETTAKRVPLNQIEGARTVKNLPERPV